MTLPRGIVQLLDRANADDRLDGWVLSAQPCQDHAVAIHAGFDRDVVEHCEAARIVTGQPLVVLDHVDPWSTYGPFSTRDIPPATPPGVSRCPPVSRSADRW